MRFPEWRRDYEVPSTAGFYDVRWAGLSFCDPAHYPLVMYWDGVRWRHPETGKPSRVDRWREGVWSETAGDQK